MTGIVEEIAVIVDIAVAIVVHLEVGVMMTTAVGHVVPQGIATMITVVGRAVLQGIATMITVVEEAVVGQDVIVLEAPSTGTEVVVDLQGGTEAAMMTIAGEVIGTTIAMREDVTQGVVVVMIETIEIIADISSADEVRDGCLFSS
jgi:hypothetical protein